MLKYMLLSCTERDIEPPQFFDTPEAAYAQMEKELLEQIGSFDNYVEGEDYEISERCAWANPHCNSDWVILPLSITGSEVSLLEAE